MADGRSFTDPEPFTVSIPDADLDDLRSRLRGARWPGDAGNGDWDYGVEKSWLQDLVRYWAEDYDWRAQEKLINDLPNYRVRIDGTPIHFVHAKGKGPDPMPIILSHGWPWTFWDWRKVIGPLTDPAAHGGDPADSFDVVVPSMPGFGFSTPLTDTGFGARKIAEYWHTLMHDVLGYRRYAVGGGDWGSTTSGEIAHGFPEQVIGAWLTLPNVPGVRLWEITEKDFAPDERWMVEQAARARSTIMSHSTVHRNEPQTLAYALADSPLGTAAWIWGRRRDWGDWRDGGGEFFDLFDRDFLCTTASIYWLTGSIASSMRIYHEHYDGGVPPPPRHDRRPAIEVPTAFAVFPRELLLLPRRVAAEAVNLQRWTVMPKGGHYPPAEQPELVVTELREFFRDLR
ncbi:epoxide hydrolase family protein [Frankia gtarii]|uniref:epoxide hydrolase family protein n=1 Tax=Frankia gtarii TaxID=2950102 RepID=UPI0021BEF74A|nr:epoxide hydrolase family protein [Frankia gtarii]